MVDNSSSSTSDYEIREGLNNSKNHILLGYWASGLGGNVIGSPGGIAIEPDQSLARVLEGSDGDLEDGQIENRTGDDCSDTDIVVKRVNNKGESSLNKDSAGLPVTSKKKRLWSIP
ncbi:hypothetical protein QYF36_018452 [Acer negundo]|nr:hypothetical protein QYF36_018452 [Acer negundo]